MQPNFSYAVYIGEGDKLPRQLICCRKDSLPMEDNAIVQLYFDRAESAIEETDKKYGRYCKSIALRILASDADAEECVNDAWLNTWNAIPPKRPSKLSAFLGRITRNLALDRHDYNTAAKRNNAFNLVLDELAEIVASSDSVEKEAEAGETAGAISAFLRELDEDARNVFLRRYWFADAVADISVRFGMSESKVKSMLFRTRNKLRAHLEQESLL